MPLPRFERLDPEKRRALLSVAASEFAAKGYEGASLNEILAAAGLGKSSYYYYFSDKEDLFATILEDLLKRIDEESERPDFSKLDARTFWPELEGWAERSVRVMARYPEIVPLSRQILLVWRAPTGRFQELVTRAHAETRAFLEVGRRLGCIRTDIDLDWLVAIVRAADQAVDERLFKHGSPENLGEHIRVALDTFRRLVEARR
ncbi:MAG TPA: TetR/AcrR family transcriptional regulator [Myxococcales bacterium]|nr:TetR/AcrR family transcriptional regulator [Myxococcales bacterium]